MYFLLKEIAIFISKHILTSLTMIEILTVSSKGQVVIPQSIRKQLKIRPGTKLVMQTQQEKVILQTESEFEKHLVDEDKQWELFFAQNAKNLWDDDGEEWEKYL